MQQLEEDYRTCVLSHLTSLGQEVPPGVDPLDFQLPDQIAEESSDAGQYCMLCNVRTYMWGENGHYSTQFDWLYLMNALFKSC